MRRIELLTGLNADEMLIIAGIFGFVILVGGVAIVFSRRRENSALRWLVGHGFNPAPASDVLEWRSSEVTVPSTGGKVLWRYRSAGGLVVFAYRCFSGAGRSLARHTYCCIQLPFAAATGEILIVERRPLGSSAAPSVAPDQYDPAFSSRFDVFAPDAQAARRILDKRLQVELAAAPAIGWVHIRAGTMVLAIPREPCEAAVSALIDLAARLGSHQAQRAEQVAA